MNKQVLDYIDGIVIPSDIAVKRMKTGEYVREICENIERAAKEVYGLTAIHEDDMTCVESTQIYYIPCVENTLTTGGYFCCVYLYMEDDFMDADCYETKIQIMFSEMEPEVDEHHDYEIWEGPESTFNINVGPDGFDVEYKPLKDPEHYPMMTGDVEKITAFMKIINERTWRNPDPLDMMKVYAASPKRYKRPTLKGGLSMYEGAFVVPDHMVPVVTPVIDYSPENINNNEASSICSECGGACCKKYAGGYHPNDFDHEITEDFLESIFNPVITDSPQISIDWYENYKEDGRKGFFIRPRHVGGDIVDPSYGEQCSLLTETGCKLDWDHRPWICRALIPNSTHACGDPNFDPKFAAAEAWEPYHDILEKLFKKYDKQTYTGTRILPGDFLTFLGLR